MACIADNSCGNILLFIYLLCDYYSSLRYLDQKYTAIMNNFRMVNIMTHKNEMTDI